MTLYNYLNPMVEDFKGTLNVKLTLNICECYKKSCCDH